MRATFFKISIYLTCSFVLTKNIYALCQNTSSKEFDKFIKSEKQPLRVIFFSTWCSDCKDELLKLKEEKLFNAHPNEKEILVNTFDTKGNADRVLKNLGIEKFCFYDNKNEIAKEYKVQTVPVSLNIRP